ncbi:MAG: glutamate--tRNA ligase [Proteobacteria bacterium]|nr:glutamate--tRNA ligase [Burkholderiales bacterium]
MTTVRTRFAPSPTGYLHIGGARTALFAWAYARKHGGSFVLRIEDTDLERSSQTSVQAILDGLAWLGIDWDEGPEFQMQRLARYQEIAEGMIRDGLAYYCYATKQELDEMREQQRARGEKPRYDGRWRDTTRTPPAGVPPVVRLKNPLEGEVVFNDLVKGPISVANAEMDDFVLLRADGVPTYNFGVVVDDLDMSITHVIRGDDHVNNTPRQINVYRALSANLPHFAHVPMILGPDGERLSKRHGAVSVMQYHEDGYLREAMVNYLARLGWSHGDEEVFSTTQLIDWFDLGHVSRSPAQFNPEKLGWLNHEYIKRADDVRLGAAVEARLLSAGVPLDDGPLPRDAVPLFKDRARTLVELADGARLLYAPVEPDATLLAQHLTEAVRGPLQDVARALEQLTWSREEVGALIKRTAATHSLKLPQLMMPLRVIIAGTAQTPSLDAVIALSPRARVLARLARYLA